MRIRAYTHICKTASAAGSKANLQGTQKEPPSFVRSLLVDGILCTRLVMELAFGDRLGCEQRLPFRRCCLAID